MGRRKAEHKAVPAPDRIATGAGRDAAILKLGRLLVRELNLERETDTLARWMAHHIAELMHIAETEEEVSGLNARRACQDAVIALWTHRAGLPGRASRSELLDGWTKLLRSQNSPWSGLILRSSQTSEKIERSDTEAYFELAQKLRTIAEPLIRAALHIAVQAADPAEVEIVKAIAEAQLEDEEAKLTRFLIDWSNKKLPQTEEMQIKVKNAVENFVLSANSVLDALERLKTNKAAIDERGDEIAAAKFNEV